MIKFYSPTLDAEVNIRFQHVTPNGVSFMKPGTDCYMSIVFANGKEEKFNGSSFLHESDNFSKRVGRKISLLKTLAEASDNLGMMREPLKDFRTEVWSQYFLSTENFSALNRVMG